MYTSKLSAKHVGAILGTQKLRTIDPRVYVRTKPKPRLVLPQVARVIIYEAIKDFMATKNKIDLVPKRSRIINFTSFPLLTFLKLFL